MTELVNDWKFWAFIIQAFITIFGFSIIKFNDFKHLTRDVKDINENVKKNTSKLNKIDKNQALNNLRITSLEEKK